MYFLLVWKRQRWLENTLLMATAAIKKKASSGNWDGKPALLLRPSQPRKPRSLRGVWLIFEAVTLSLSMAKRQRYPLPGGGFFRETKLFEGRNHDRGFPDPSDTFWRHLLTQVVFYGRLTSLCTTWSGSWMKR